MADQLWLMTRIREEEEEDGPHRTSCLLRSAGGILLSALTWSSHLLRGRPDWVGVSGCDLAD